MNKAFLYALIPASLLLASAILFPLLGRDRIYYVEGNDEAAHTFVEIPMVYRALVDSHILKINIFNNFGTPLLGDPIACPFAPHAATYAFLRPPVAMTVNMGLLAFFSVLVLALFFSRYLTPLSAVVASVTAVTTPSFYYFIHHHPFQGTLFYYGLILWLSERVAEDRRPRNLVLLCFAYVIFFLGVRHERSDPPYSIPLPDCLPRPEVRAEVAGRCLRLSAADRHRIPRRPCASALFPQTRPTEPTQGYGPREDLAGLFVESDGDRTFRVHPERSSFIRTSPWLTRCRCFCSQ